MEYAQLMVNTEEGFVDFTLEITKFKKQLLGGYIIECFGKYQDKVVGVGFYLKPDMQGIIDGDINTWRTYRDGMKILSLGLPSDELLGVLAGEYGVAKQNLKMKKEVIIECGALSGNPGNIANEPVHFKGFLNAHSKTDYYAEIYLNFDIKLAKVEINEKDSEYRENFISSLAQQHSVC